MRTISHRLLRTVGALCLLIAQTASVLAQGTASTPAPAAIILELRGEGVKVSRQPGVWDPARANQPLYPGNIVSTDERSQALVRFSELETVRVAERSTLRVQEPAGPRRRFEFLKGLLHFFSREKPNQFEVQTPQMSAITRGTEFTLEVTENGSTLSLIEGEVLMGNPFGELDLKSGERGLAKPGQRPRQTARLDAINIIQWCLYYPAVLNLDELPLGAQEREVLSESLAAYQRGDLVAAITAYPKDRQPASDEERIYLAALRLSFGELQEAQSLLDAIQPEGASIPLGGALRRLISAVKSPSSPSLLERERAGVRGQTSTSLLADSYLLQSQLNLTGALAAARQAVERAPNFSFAWARVAELEFTFGRTRAASDAVEKSLQLAPRNAQAHALRGFLLAARNQLNDALAAFAQSIAIDPMLANAWLGRGLCRIKQGHAEAGREDLQVAATVEPNRAVLRSYLGKAFSNAGDDARAGKELALARNLDPNDPTAWLYSALFLQQQNQINEAIRDLEHSEALNENRSLYRSRLLLDQDQAVRRANLANLYLDVGMTDVSQREAARAVSDDYGNYSTHLFLANTYDALRDPRQINLRYETAWLSEYLIANLLAPAAAGAFSPVVSQNEYGRLLERDGFGLVSSTEYFSRGDWVQSGAQYGIFGNSSYAIEENYRSENGYRPNNDLEQLTLSVRLKQQLTPKDSVFLQGIYYNASAGDVTPQYDPTNANLGLRTKERQEPTLLAGYHHEWAPGVDTLLLAGRLQDTLNVENTNQQTFFVQNDLFGPGIASVTPQSFSQTYRSEFEVGTVEVQQILQQPDHQTVLGGRYQWGEFETRSQLTNSRPSIPFSPDQNVTADFARGSVYGYHSWQVASPLLLVAGLTYDHLKSPRNFRYAPIAEGEETTDQISPKGGFVWTPTRDTTVRAAYSRALGGVSFDQSYQLEPSQVAGFNQSWRSLIPEGLVGANSGARFETWGVSLEQRFPTRTYFGLAGAWLNSDLSRNFGVALFAPGFQADQTRENLDFSERTLTFTVNQLVGDEWSFGARYRISRAQLTDEFPDLIAPGFVNRLDQEATLMQLDLLALYNHPSGFFAGVEPLWTSQHNDSPELPGDSFWQLNVWMGYRFPHRRAEARIALLNVTDHDYHLNPLNLTTDLPHDRTLMASLRFNF